MGVPIDLRVTRSSKAIVEKVLERLPEYRECADELAIKAHRYLNTFRKFSIARRRRGAKRQATIDKAAKEGIVLGLSRKVYIPPVPCAPTLVR